MNKWTSIVLLTLVLLSCEQSPLEDPLSKTKGKVETESSRSQIKNSAIETEWNYKKVNESYLDTILHDICTIHKVEFVDLYPILDKIASDAHEKLVLVDTLKSMGYQVKQWGRGNWMKGPRMINFAMSNGTCDCFIDKLYYSTEEKDKFEVTERISCKEMTE